MNVKLLLYAFSLLSSIFAVSGINFEKIIKKNRVWECRFLSMLIIFALSYLVANFLYDLGCCISL